MHVGRRVGCRVFHFVAAAFSSAFFVRRASSSAALPSRTWKPSKQKKSGTPSSPLRKLRPAEQEVEVLVDSLVQAKVKERESGSPRGRCLQR